MIHGFVFAFFIPIIPLKKLRVLNDCPQCRRHRMLSRKEWETLIDETLNPLLEEHKNVNSIESMAKLVNGMISLGLITEAKKSLRDFEHVFGPHQEVKYLQGNIASIEGNWKLSAQYYHQAIEKDGTNGKYHEGLSSMYWAANEREKSFREIVLATELDKDNSQYWQLRAWRGYLLQKFSDALTAFETAATLDPNFKNQEHVDVAIEQCKYMLANPGAKFVSPEEKPKSDGMTLFGKLVIAALILLVVGGYILGNIMTASSRKVRFYNDTPQNVTVIINDKDTYKIHPTSFTRINLSEGHHKIIVKSQKGKVIDDKNIQIETPFFTRIFNNPIFCYNVGGHGIFAWENIHYTTSRHIKSRSQVKYITGKHYIYYPNIRYRYVKAPKSVKIESSSEFRTRFSKVPYSHMQMATYFIRMKQKHKAIGIYERLVRFEPGNSEALKWLHFYKIAEKKKKAFIAFLEEVAGNDPAKITIHRFLQDTFSGTNRVQTKYAKILEKNPKSADAHYLYYRVTEDSKYLKKALKLNPACVWSVWATAYLEMRAGEYERAARKFKKILYRKDIIRGVPPKIISSYADCQYAQGKYRTLQKFLIYNKHFARDDAALCEYFITTGKLKDHYAMTSKLNSLKRIWRNSDFSYYEYLYYWASGNFQKVNTIIAKWALKRDISNIRIQVALASGEKLQARYVKKILLTGPFNERLILAALYPNRKESRTFFTHHQKIYRYNPRIFEVLNYIQGKGDLKKVLPLLNHSAALYKRYALLACILSVERVGKMTELTTLLKIAKKNNFRPVFPYHIVNRKYKKYVK